MAAEPLDAYAGGDGAGGGDAKYLEALRKARALTVKLEKERTANAKLAQQLAALEQKVQELEGNPLAPRPDGTDLALPGSEEDAERQQRQLRDALARANAAVAELRRANQQLKDDAKRTRAALAREVGEDVPLDRVLDEAGGWRGRAQQISLLKSRVKELQRALQAQGPGTGTGPGGAGAADDAASTAPSVRTAASHGLARDFDDVNKENIDKIQSDRLASLARLQLELQEALAQAKEWKEKAEGLAARCTNLEKYATDLKMKLHRVIEKTENDDRLIESYKQEIDRLKRAARKHVQLQQQQQQAGAPDAATTPTDGAEAAAVIRRLKAELNEARQRQLYPANAPASAPDDAVGGGDAQKLRVCQVELQKSRELCELLRQQLAAERGAQRSREGAAGPGPAAGGGNGPRRGSDDGAGAGAGAATGGGAMGALDKVRMLKDENASLKAQLSALARLRDEENAQHEAAVRELQAELAAALGDI